LVEQLNESARELATLRTANAKLQSKQSPASPVSSAVAKADPLEEKMAASLKSYASFKQEMLAVLTEIERSRQENAGLSSNLRAAVDQAEQARASVARLEKDLRAEQKVRAEAEKLVGELREQLRAVARALSAAGLSVDKLSAGAEKR
jgi:uncharacterized coiled-coil DUF342 family protein